MSRRLAAAEATWQSSDQPAWLTERFYQEQIQPHLARVSEGRMAAALGVSRPYAVDVRSGRCRPHPRHWQTLATLTGVSPPKIK